MIISITRLISAFIGAFLSNIPWLILFIVVGKSPGEIIRIVLWCIAPLFIATGYSFWIIVYDRIVLYERDSYRKIIPWALSGCVIGEILALISGPMVIGVSVFTGGGAALLLREYRLYHT